MKNQWKSTTARYLHKDLRKCYQTRWWRLREVFPAPIATSRHLDPRMGGVIWRDTLSRNILLGLSLTVTTVDRSSHRGIIFHAMFRGCIKCNTHRLLVQVTWLIKFIKNTSIKAKHIFQFNCPEILFYAMLRGCIECYNRGLHWMQQCLELI